ncbi:MAG: hypothetical protein WDM81_12285 [Rhizomicrobium sp.]
MRRSDWRWAPSSWSIRRSAPSTTRCSARPPPDDVNRYAPEALAALARLVRSRALAHRPGGSDVFLFCARDEDKDYAENDTVLVAVNDDKPFLFDSLIADVTAGGGRLRAVFPSHRAAERPGGERDRAGAGADPERGAPRRDPCTAPRRPSPRWRSRCATGAR